LAIQTCTAREVYLWGPARAAKTFGILYKLHKAAETYPGARLLIIRQTRESLTDSALVTLEDEILPPLHPSLTGIQRANRHSYRYLNGSEIVVAGFKQSTRDQTARIMGTSYDMIFGNEGHELLESQVQQLLTRLSNYKTPYQQLVLDFNPPPPLHWVWRREKSGNAKMLRAELQDNPRWWNANAGTWTTDGQAMYDTLSTLKGIERDRYFLGRSVMAEGLIYGDVWSDGPADGNVTEAAEYVQDGGPILWAVDDGYSAGSMPSSRGIDPQTGEYVGDSHPRAILLVQQKSDGHLDIFAESYTCMMLSDVHIREALALGYPAPDFAVHGPGSAEIRGRLFEANVPPRQSTAKVDESIKEMRTALAADANGWRRVRVHPRCRHFRAEMASYAYEPGSEKPVKMYDHGPDSLRGLLHVMRFER
ncbi:MAG TPA: hypothetical protein VII92_10025, partial [Anaerolineae bacterium]